MAALEQITSSAAAIFGIRTAEEPRYNEMGRIGSIELRHYPARLAAEVSVAGDALAARSRGFQILAGFIFGKNRERAKIAMTAPVAQQDAAKISMAASVGQQHDAEGKWRVRFFMPDSYTRETLPEPVDPRVQIVTIPESVTAVLRFAGRPTSDLVARQEAALLSALQRTKWRPIGTPMGMFYDPPWTLSPLRRNEAAVEVSQATPEQDKNSR